MKWDKQKIYFSLLDKAQRLRGMGETRKEWLVFLGSLSIVEVRRERSRGQYWMDFNGKPAKNKDRLIIRDPWWVMFELPDNQYSHGLSVPKDIAEKFLVLGIP